MAEFVDINCDMGESFGRWSLGNDAGVMPYITSANIACGWHGGDPGVMRETVALAKEHEVGIGAHVAFPDLLGFGRRQIIITPQETRDYILYQYGALRAFADSVGARVGHIKPHGAFYVYINRNAEHAEALAAAVLEVDPGLAVILMGKEAIDICASRGVAVAPEAFPDLEYNADGTLILERAKQPRDPGWVADRIVRVLRDDKLKAADGTDLDVFARTFCIHGDSPNAVDVVRGVRDRLTAEGFELSSLDKVAAAA